MSDLWKRGLSQQVPTSQGSFTVHYPHPEDADDESVASGDPHEDGFNGRLPILYHPETSSIYVGGPNWYHADTRDYHEAPFPTQQGYIGGGKYWGNNALTWYMRPPAEHEAINEAVRKVIPGIPDPEQAEPDWQDEGLDWGD